MHCYVLDITPAKQSLIDAIASECGLKPFSVLVPFVGKRPKTYLVI